MIVVHLGMKVWRAQEKAYLIEGLQGTKVLVGFYLIAVLQGM